MNQQELFNAFGGKISKTCLVSDQTETGSYMIQGKYCWIQTAFDRGDDIWNIWIGNPFDMAKGLGQRKVRNIARVLDETCVKTAYRELDGEADMWVVGTEGILQNLKLLGIRKKREISAGQREKMIQRLVLARRDTV